MQIDSAQMIYFRTKQSTLRELVSWHDSWVGFHLRLRSHCSYFQQLNSTTLLVSVERGKLEVWTHPHALWNARVPSAPNQVLVSCSLSQLVPSLPVFYRPLFLFTFLSPLSPPNLSLTLNLHKPLSSLSCLPLSALRPCSTLPPAPNHPTPHWCFICFNLIWCYLI